jgi:hypothetical protein
MRTNAKRTWIFLVIFVLAAALVPSMAGESFKKALTDGDPLIDVRYRLEHVDQRGELKTALASTIRLRGGYKTEKFYDFFGLAEFAAIRTVGGATYNSTANGRDQYAVVVDPEDEEVNRAFLAWSRNPDRVVKLGRQRVILDNQRFFGNVAWRQNEQTFDALTYKDTTTKYVDAFYARINNANTVFGEHHPNPAVADIALTADLFHAAHTCSAGTTTGYVYLLEFDDTPLISHKDIGLRFVGDTEVGRGMDLLYTGEYAAQSDYEQGESIIDADYWLIELGLRRQHWTYTLGYELLGGDGAWAFQTPFATGHKFNGWADKFLLTPLDGLRDIYVSAERKTKGYRFAVIFHDFESDAGSTSYGRELDLLFVKPLGDIWTFGVKAAKYDADDYATDTEKIWTWISFKI